MINRVAAVVGGLLLIAAASPPGTIEAAATVTLVPSVPSGQPVGTTVTWTVTTNSPDPMDFRLSVKPIGSPLRVMYDFSPNNVFDWTPIDDDTYIVVASARNGITNEISHAAAAFVIQPRAVLSAVVNQTPHPLVALYSVPPCIAGDVYVLFKPAVGGQFSSTTSKPCRPGRTLNFYIAGMPADTNHWMRHIRVVNGDVVEQGQLLPFRTGTALAVPPQMTLVDPPDPDGSPEGILLHGPVNTGVDILTRFPFATNLLGQMIWYDRRAGVADLNLYRPVTGGTLLLVEDRDAADQVLREVDLAGNILRETTAPRISEQLEALGQDRFTAFHHEARRLPSGHTVLLGAVERILVDVQGPGPVNVLGDYIVVLDQNWQVSWFWNGFDHLDQSRKAVLNETCVSEGPGCPPLFLGPTANDWLHSNAIAYSAGDGNLILSMRHQDWVIKIDYRNGAGDGHVIWRLGAGGDFSLAADPLLAWFSHQHDPNWDAQGRLAVYDNGNTRCAIFSDCVSRGQVYQLDEANLTASLVVNADLGNYSAALGSAQPLANGNFHFNSGFQNPPSFTGWSDEVRPDGTSIHRLGISTAVYRSFRVRSLYVAPEDQPPVAPVVP